MKKRHWGAVFIVAFIVTTIGIAYPLTAAGQTIPMPAGQEVYSFDPMSLPFVSSDPAQSRPVGLGPMATGGDIFNIHAGIGRYSEPVDVYMVLYIPTIDPSIMYFISEDYTIVPATAGFVAWKKGITGPVNEVLFSNVPQSLLPPGQYVVGTFITPANDFSRYYLYLTEFILGAGEAAVEDEGEGDELYAQHCASCHSPLAGSNKKGRTAEQIQAAIDGNVGGMGTPGMRGLTAAQVQALADALVARQAAPSVAMSMPFLPKTFNYEAVDFPVMSSKPAESKPIGLGAAAQGGGTLSIMVDIGSFTGFMDIYFAMSLSTLDNNIFVLGPDNSLQPLSAGFVPWKKGVKEPISETLMDNIPIDTLPQGIYTFYLLAAPEGMINTYYMWKTEVIIGPPDGAKLYAQNCASCHGPLNASKKAGTTAARTQTAIDGNVGGMGGLKNLTPAQVKAIADVLAAQAPPPPPATTDGATLYNEACASCHGPLNASGKAGTTAGAIQTAIDAGIGGMGGLNNLSAAQVQAIADVLGGQAPPPPPTTTDGATLYAQGCASCHGPLATSAKLGTTVGAIQSAINGNVGGMGSPTLKGLSAVQVQAIADVLGTQAPPPPPATTDGATLYAQGCQSCHGPLATSAKLGTTVGAIQTAINGNVGGMGTPVLKSLSAVQVQAIATVLNAQAPPPPPATTDGTVLYANNCASCHNPLATSAKLGTTAGAIQTAINGNVGGMGTPVLLSLSAVQVQNIATVLNSQAPPPPPPTTDGTVLYGNNCASCHNPLATTNKPGRTATQIQTAINGNVGGMGTPVLLSLTAVQVQAIANVLPAPPVTTDGVVLYDQNCASCHNPLATSNKPGRTAAQIQTAINGDIGGMGGLSILSAVQVQAIANVLPPMPSDGPSLYAANCATCHGDLAFSDVRGSRANAIQDAINNDKGGMGGLSFLTPAQVQLIADALAGLVAVVPRQDQYIIAGGSTKTMELAMRKHRAIT